MKRSLFLGGEEKVWCPHLGDILSVDGERVGGVREGKAFIVPGLSEVYVHTVVLKTMIYDIQYYIKLI